MLTDIHGKTYGLGHLWPDLAPPSAVWLPFVSGTPHLFRRTLLYLFIRFNVSLDIIPHSIHHLFLFNWQRTNEEKLNLLARKLIEISHWTPSVCIRMLDVTLYFHIRSCKTHREDTDERS
jgi:hypothetical protein